MQGHRTIDRVEGFAGNIRSIPTFFDGELTFDLTGRPKEEVVFLCELLRRETRIIARTDYGDEVLYEGEQDE